LPAEAKSGAFDTGASTLLGAVLMGIAGYTALIWAPVERTMGNLYRIFYFHMPCGINGFIAFSIVLVAGIIYLVKRNPKADWLAVSAAELGVAFIGVNMVTGSIWGKAAWGVWWVWDARLTSDFVLWMLFVCYLLLRTLIDDPHRKAVVSSVFGIFAALDVPLVYMSTRWWRTQHPSPVIMGGPNSGLAPQMAWALLICWICLAGLMLILLRVRYQLEALRHEVAELEVEAASQASA
jgi:heme exporter protein C